MQNTDSQKNFGMILKFSDYNSDRTKMDFALSRGNTMFSRLKRTGLKIKEFCYREKRRIVATSILFTIAAVCMFVSVISINIFALYHGDSVIYVSTFSDSSEKALALSGITLTEYDKVEGPKKAEDGITELVIRRGFPVRVHADEKTHELVSYGETVQSLLYRANIDIGQQDEISPSLYTAVTAETDIMLYRIESRFEEEVVEIPYESIRKPSLSINAGEERMVQQGVAGEKKLEAEVFYRDGEEISRQVIRETVLKDPVSEIIEYGTGGTVTTEEGEQLRFKRVLDMKAYAYTNENGAAGVYTASGTRARVGAIAVDPKVIPLGTRLYITSADGESWVYGVAVAEDTGSAIKGNKIDLFFNTMKECRRFGAQDAKVYILE